MRIIVFEEEKSRLKKIVELLSGSLKEQDEFCECDQLEQLEKKLGEEKYDLFVTCLPHLEDGKSVEQKIQLVEGLFQTRTEMLILCLADREEIQNNLLKDPMYVLPVGIYPLEKKYVHIYMETIRKRLEKKENYILEVRVNRKKRYLDCGEIQYLESRGHNVYIHMINQEVVVYQKLSNLYDKLPKCFVQCHKSFVVNLSYIKRIREYKIIIENYGRGNTELPVSRANRENFEKEYKKFEKATN